MHDKLSYLSMRVVVEYLEANKRLHIAARSPQLRNIDKSIPLRLKNLEITKTSVRFNDIKYRIFYPIPLVYFDLEQSRRFTIEKNIKETMLFKQESRQIPKKNREGVEAGVTMAHALLGYKDIYSNSVTFGKDFWVDAGHCVLDKVPSNFKVRTRKVTAIWEDYNEHKQFIHPDSFPLNVFTFCIPHHRLTFEDPLLNTAKTIVISGSSQARVLRKFPNNNIRVDHQDGLQVDEFLKLVEFWIQDSREIGKTFKMYVPKICRYFKRLEQHFEVTSYKCEFSGSNIKMVTVIPMNEDSELWIIRPSCSRLYSAFPVLMKVKQAGAMRLFQAMKKQDDDGVGKEFCNLQLRK